MNLDNREVVLAKADDWTALYIDGVKAIENHSLSEAEIFEALGLNVREVWLDECWLEENGHHFPATVEELVA